MRRLVILVVALALATVGTACSEGGDGSGSSGHSGTTPLVGTNWVLSTATDLGTTLEGVAVSAIFSSREVSGESGCNTYRGPYERDGSSLRIGPDLATTLIGCDGPQASVERVYLQRLPRVRSYAITGDRLTLRDDDGSVLLVYEASGAAELDAAWVVTSYYTGDAVQSVVGDTEVTAEFADGQVNGNAGCNSFGGAVETSGDDITIGPLQQTLRLCADPELQQQEDHYLAALQLASTFRVTGDRLDLYRPDGGIAATFVRAR